MIYELLFNYYNKLPDICGEALRLSRAKSNMNTWERIRNSNLRDYKLLFLSLIIAINKSTIFTS